MIAARSLLVLSVSALLSGCALTDRLLTNRVGVTLSMDECRVDSRWFGPGFSIAVDERDCEVILQAARLRAMQQLMNDQSVGMSHSVGSGPTKVQ